MWENYVEFGENFTGYSYPILGWPLALEIVRSFNGYPDVSEIEICLSDTYDDWRTTSSLMRIYPSFVSYLRNKLQFQQKSLLASPYVSMVGTFSNEESEDEGNYDATATGYNTPLYKSLEAYGLLPAVWENPVGTVRNHGIEDDDAMDDDNPDGMTDGDRELVTQSSAPVSQNEHHASDNPLKRWGG